MSPTSSPEGAPAATPTPAPTTSSETADPSDSNSDRDINPAGVDAPSITMCRSSGAPDSWSRREPSGTPSVPAVPRSGKVSWSNAP